jgi:type IV pilus assembly protein PilX
MITSINSFAFIKKSQSGVVLFLALIALVVMSLAAVALIRSVDTNSQIAGNLSYKQTAAISSSYGIESVADTLGPLPMNNANTSNASTGYYAVCNTFDQGVTEPCNGRNLTAEASWVPGTTSNFANGLGVDAGVDAYGNTIQYIVERMCNAAAPFSRATCLLSTSDPDNDTKRVQNEPVSGRPTKQNDLPIYRVTVRIAGPKNTVSFVQAFLSN